MRTRAVIFMSLIALAECSGAGTQCAPPEGVTANLRVHFAYEHGLEGRKRSTFERFTMLTSGSRTFLRHDNPGPGFDPNMRAVFVFEDSRRAEGLNCPAAPNWVNCVAEWVQNPHKDEGKVVYGNEPPTYTAPAPKEPTCEFTLEVPPWKPSPNDETKTRVATKVLRELQDFGYSDAKAIYIRDFNLNDPDVIAYIVKRNGIAEIQGCGFRANETPHCQWHMFGKSPVESLRRQVMAQPYRLYPPPMGRP